MYNENVSGSDKKKKEDERKETILLPSNLINSKIVNACSPVLPNKTWSNKPKFQGSLKNGKWCRKKIIWSTVAKKNGISLKLKQNYVSATITLHILFV